MEEKEKEKKKGLQRISIETRMVATLLMRLYQTRIGGGFGDSRQSLSCVIDFVHDQRSSSQQSSSLSILGTNSAEVQPLSSDDLRTNRFLSCSRESLV